MQIKLRGFTVPNFVVPEVPPLSREEGFHPSGSIPLGDLDPDTLSDLCDQFRFDVFKRAGKADPSKRP